VDEAADEAYYRLFRELNGIEEPPAAHDDDDEHNDDDDDFDFSAFDPRILHAEASDFEDVFAVNIDPDEVLTRSRAMVAMLRTLGIDPDTHAAVLMFLNRIRWPMVWDPLTRGMGSYREAWLRGRAVGQGEDMEAPAGTHLRRFKLGTSIPAIAHDLQKCFDMLLTGPKLDGAFMLPIPDNPYPPRENNKSKFMKCDRCTNMSILGPAHPVSHAEGEHIYKRRKD
jgi:hypothetical protein